MNWLTTSSALMAGSLVVSTPDCNPPVDSAPPRHEGWGDGQERGAVGMTIIEKILSSRAGGAPVSPGQIVTCDVDRVVMLDLQFAGGPRPVRVHDPSRISVVLDHA